MPKIFTSKMQKIGELGEEIAAKYLVSLGYKIIERNYTFFTGEIDIVCRKEGILHLFEVKSVSYLLADVSETNMNISRETSIRPEENVHEKKLRKLAITAEQYLINRGVSHETKWQIDLICVYIDRENKNARVKLLERII